MAMRDKSAGAAAAPLDQADGLRRLFAGRAGQVLALVANPHLDCGAAVLDHLAAVLAAQGRQVLVVDAAAGAPTAHELARLDLAACIEPVAPRLAYLAARGLPPRFVDTRGSAGGFIDALQRAAPQAEVLLLHADAGDLARLLKGRALRPLLLGADEPESIKHAYAACKLLVQRSGLMSFDLLLAASPASPRSADIAASLGRCADVFLGAVLRDWALLDPALTPDEAARAPAPALRRLLGAQLDTDAEFDKIPSASSWPAAGAIQPAAAARIAAARASQPPRPVFR